MEYKSSIKIKQKVKGYNAKVINIKENFTLKKAICKFHISVLV